MSGVSLHALNLKGKQDKETEAGGVKEEARRSNKREHACSWLPLWLTMLAHDYPWLTMADHACLWLTMADHAWPWLTMAERG